MALESLPSEVKPALERTPGDEEILARVRREGTAAWPAFIEAYAETLFRVVALFADSYDDRMDLFLYLCARLREKEMKRVRTFRPRVDAPCRFSTYLTVVAKNLAVDHFRSQEGRYRPFRRIAAMEEADRLLFEYHVREGKTLEESRSLLQGRHGIRLTIDEVAERAGRIESSLSANQRWKLLARLATRRRPLPIDPVADAALERDRSFPLESARGDPEADIHRRDAERLFQEALASLGARSHLALVLRFKDSLSLDDVGRTLAIPTSEAERLVRDALSSLRRKLSEAGIGRDDLESTFGLGFGSQAASATLEKVAD